LCSLIGTAGLCPAQAIKVAPFPVPEGSFRAGGVALKIPSPSSDLIEMGSDMRVVAEVLVPFNNRLLAAFIPSDDLAEIAKGMHRELPRYSLVEVPRAVEFADIDEMTFKTVVETTKKQFAAGVLTTAAKSEEEDINRKIAALGMKTGKITLEKPVHLGTIFSKPNSYASAMMMPVTTNGKTMNMVASIGMFRLRNRLVLGYIYSEYKDEDSVHWVSRVTEEWADALLKANGE
jgi:CxxC motif-containing protein